MFSITFMINMQRYKFTKPHRHKLRDPQRSKQTTMTVYCCNSLYVYKYMCKWCRVYYFFMLLKPQQIGMQNCIILFIMLYIQKKNLYNCVSLINNKQSTLSPKQLIELMILVFNFSTLTKRLSEYVSKIGCGLS